MATDLVNASAGTNLLAATTADARNKGLFAVKSDTKIVNSLWQPRAMRDDSADGDARTGRGRGKA
jgi:hypothetical protein